MPLTTTLNPNSPPLEEKIASEIRTRVEKAQKSIIFIDRGATRHAVLPEVEELIDITCFPFFTTPMGKGAISERKPTFGGVYAGARSKPDVKQVVESGRLCSSYWKLPSRSEYVSPKDPSLLARYID